MKAINFAKVLVKKHMSDAIINDPAFSVFADKRRFQNVAEKLLNDCCEDQ